MKKGLLKVFAMACVLTLMLAQVVNVRVSADDTDIVLNDAGSPLIRVIDPGEGDGYTYMGYVYCGEGIGSEYGYLQLSYKGDATAFSQLRIEVLDGSDAKIGVFWFSENDEGSFRTSDGNLLPAPSDEVQTVVVDFAASGIDVSNGIHAMHIHDTQGTGAVTFTDARLMTGNGSAAEEPIADKTEDTAATDEPAASEPTADEPAEEAPAVVETLPQTGGYNLVIPCVVVGCGVVFVGACMVLKVAVEKR